MRITNKIMQNNSLSNLNINKILQDKLNTQMASEKKINRPSDDPVIAIRALRLRSSLTEITQYYEKNVPDANSWLEITEKALSTTAQVIEDMYANCNKGVNGTLDTKNRQIILDALKGLRDEVYATGNADFAGRSVFTGYRTDMDLTFRNDTKQQFTISEQLGKDAIDKITHITTAKPNEGNLADVNESNYNNAGMTMDETDVESTDVYRIRLAYDEIDQKDVTLQWGAKKDADGKIIFDQSITLNPANAKNSYDIPSPYENLDPDAIILVKDTGEVLLGKNAYDKMMAVSDDPKTLDVNEGEIRVTYDKSEWDKGDLNPVHYYACSSTKGANTVQYNANYLQNQKDRQDIEYDIGFNQSIKVNTTAEQAYTHGVGRDVDELTRAIQDVLDMEKVESTLKEIVAANPNDADAKERYAAAQKAVKLLKNKEQLMFEKSQTKMQGHLNKVTQATTDCGTLGARLEMAEKRLQSQQTTFDTLASENENIDITKVAIELSSAELAYQAALMATGKVVQNTLLNFL